MDNLSGLGRATAELPGTWISEVVLQTGRFDALKDWYAAVLGRPWYFENTPKCGPLADLPAGEKQVRAADVRACFMRLEPGFPYGATFALFELPGISPAPTRDPGLNHMQFKCAQLEALVTRVELLRDAGIHPQRSANHGPVLSFYFKDPDQNVVEFCCNNFATAEEMVAFTRSARFQANPSGLELDRDDFVARYRAGEPLQTLLAI